MSPYRRPHRTPGREAQLARWAEAHRRQHRRDALREAAITTAFGVGLALWAAFIVVMYYTAVTGESLP